MGALVTVGINTLGFFLIAKMVPGFNIRNEKTAFLISIAYSFLMYLTGLLILPVSLLLAALFTLIAIIPVIGPMIAGAGLLTTTFILVFGITAILLIIIDKLMEDFEMTSPVVAFIASFLLAVLNVVVRGILNI
jgi:uncharacterized membrane protein YvlD (DUF360 family)